MCIACMHLSTRSGTEEPGTCQGTERLDFSIVPAVPKNHLQTKHHLPCACIPQPHKESLSSTSQPLGKTRLAVGDFVPLIAHKALTRNCIKMQYGRPVGAIKHAPRFYRLRVSTNGRAANSIGPGIRLTVVAVGG